MHKFSALLIVALLAIVIGCRSTDRNARVFNPWGWEDAKDAKAHLDNYKHILVARIDESHWKDRVPHPLPSHHFKGAVVRSYKGDWRVSERIAFVHYVDFPVPTNTPSASRGDLMFVFTNEHTDAEIDLGTGEFGAYNAKYSPALDCIFLQKSSQ